MTALTLNFNDDEMKLINEYMKANKISLTDLPSIFTSFLTIKKYNVDTLRIMEEVENNIGLSKEFTNINDLMDNLK